MYCLIPTLAYMQNVPQNVYTLYLLILKIKCNSILIDTSFIINYSECAHTFLGNIYML